MIAARGGVSPALQEAVAAAGWDRLLPGHRADGDRPVGRPACVAALRLDDTLSLAVVRDEAGTVYTVPLVVRDGVRRAVPGDGAAEALVALLGRGDGQVGGLEVRRWHHRPATGERGISVDQTNESVIVGDAAVVKWAFRVEEGPHPAPSLLTELDAQGFTGMPRPWGAVLWWPPAGEPARLVALVTAYVPGAVDGWTWVVDDLRDAAVRGDAALARHRGDLLGELVATFHRSLASTARPATREETDSWRIGSVADLDRALTLTRGPAHQVLTTHEARIRTLLDAPVDEGSPVIRVHGDLHIGQVLRGVEGDTPVHVLTDFDGNPVAPPAERMREQPAALDVAGMAQSLVHAGLVVHKHDPGLPEPAVHEATAQARDAFLAAYTADLGDAASLYDARLLTRFRLRQVCREFTYAATHLPRWSYVPEAALPLLLDEVT